MTIVAVVDATSQIDRMVRTLLTERDFLVDKVRFFASVCSAGRELKFRGEKIVVEDATATSDEDPKDIDIAVFLAGGTPSKGQAPYFAAVGTVVIDSSPMQRRDSEVSLVVPEVNPDALQDTPKSIVVNPSCITMVAMPMFKSLHDGTGPQRLCVSPYRAASSSGLTDVKASAGQVRENVDNLEQLIIDGSALIAEGFGPYVALIAFNTLPMADNFVDDGPLETDEEQKFHNESRKTLSTPEPVVADTCMCVPVFTGHTLMIHAEFEDILSVEKVTELLESALGVKVVDVLNPLTVTGMGESLVGRIRVDRSVPEGRGLMLVVSGDNLRKNAVLNTIQIVELLVASQ